MSSQLKQEEINLIYMGIKESASTLLDEDAEFLQGMKGEDDEFQSVQLDDQRILFEFERVLLCACVIVRLSPRDFKNALEAINVPMIHKPSLVEFNDEATQYLVELIKEDFGKNKQINAKLDGSFSSIEKFIHERLDFYAKEIIGFSKEDSPDTGKLLWYLFHPGETIEEKVSERAIHSPVALYHFGSTIYTLLFGFLPEVVQSYRQGFNY